MRLDPNLIYNLYNVCSFILPNKGCRWTNGGRLVVVESCIPQSGPTFVTWRDNGVNCSFCCHSGWYRLRRQYFGGVKLLESRTLVTQLTDLWNREQNPHERYAGFYCTDSSWRSSRCHFLLASHSGTWVVDRHNTVKQNCKAPRLCMQQLAKS